MIREYYKRKQTVHLIGATQPEKLTVREDKYSPVYGFVRIGKETRYVRRVEDSFSCSIWREYRRIY